MSQTAPQETGHQFHDTILREYDIRGVVGDTLSAEDAYHIGKAFGTFIYNKRHDAQKVCVGYDGRVSSPELEAAIVKGLEKLGLKWCVWVLAYADAVFCGAYTGGRWWGDGDGIAQPSYA